MNEGNNERKRANERKRNEGTRIEIDENILEEIKV